MAPRRPDFLDLSKRAGWLSLGTLIWPYRAVHYTISIIISALAGVILTVVRCRKAQARHQCARWSFALAGALLAGIVTVAVIDRWDLFHLDVFINNKISVWEAAILDFMFSGAVALGLTSFVVHHYRVKFRDLEA